MNAHVEITAALAPADDDARRDDVRRNGAGKLTVADLVAMFEDAEEATQAARRLAERDRDYYDNIQLSAQELAVLKKRGQPPVIANAISRKINYLVGLEKEQRVKPKAMPRTPAHEQDADGATQAMRYVVEDQDYGHKRSGVWKNMLIEGAGGIAVAVKPARCAGPLPTPYGEPLAGLGGELATHLASSAPQFDVEIRRIPWERLFADPHSSEADYSDAAYLGVVLWMDFADALAIYGEDARDVLDTTLREAGTSATYDDRPKFRLWADRKRKRIRVVQIWLKRGEAWHFAEFTRGGILKAGPSPYVTDTGASDCELIFQSAYVNRENERYGEVRGMISPQDEKNKRRSKALHLLNTSQVVYEDGAVDDIEKFRKEAMRPDGTLRINAGFFDKMKFETRTDLAEGQFRLLAESNREMDLAGPNATQLGDKAGSSASGRAIIASQQGGMIQLGDLLDSLRHLDMRVFRAVWYRVRQFWTAEKWIRITDEAANLKWVGLNSAMEVVRDPASGQSVTRPRLDPTGRPMPVTPLAALDCDIIIEEAPDSITPQLEQWQGLTELAKSGVPIPPDVLIEAAPNLKNKQRILDRMREPQPGSDLAQQMQQLSAQLQLALGQARVADVQAGAQLKHAQAMKTAREAVGAGGPEPHTQGFPLSPHAGLATVGAAPLPIQDTPPLS